MVRQEGTKYVHAWGERRICMGRAKEGGDTMRRWLLALSSTTTTTTTKKKKKRSVVRVAGADAFISFCWSLAISTLGPCTDSLSSYLGIYGKWRALILFILLTALVWGFSILARALAQAYWNPATLLAHSLLLSPLSSPSSSEISLLAARLLSQAIGAIGGVLTAVEYAPGLYVRHHLRGGPRLKVGKHMGAFVEAILTLLFTFMTLFAVLCGPKRQLERTLFVSVTLFVLILLGSKYTGPSMNPAYAFGWAYLRNQHKSFEHLYVFAIAPIVGALVASQVFKKHFLDYDTRNSNLTFLKKLY